MRLKPTRLRWFSQIVFFSLFLFLLLHTEFRGSLHGGGGEIRLPYPVQLFFQFDPLVALSNALSSRALYHGLLWSLVVLIPTMFLGRFFCGWICPLGSIHHFFSSLRSERIRGKQLIESNRYKRWQTTKYYLFVATLTAAVLGTAIVGWLDPFSLLVRSLGLQSELAQDVTRILTKMERIAGRESIAPENRKEQRLVIVKLRRQLERLRAKLPKARMLSNMAPKERRLLERVFGLVYECSSNQSAAKILVEKIMHEMN